MLRLSLALRPLVHQAFDPGDGENYLRCLAGLVPTAQQAP